MLKYFLLSFIFITIATLKPMEGDREYTYPKSLIEICSKQIVNSLVKNKQLCWLDSTKLPQELVEIIKNKFLSIYSNDVWNIRLLFNPNNFRESFLEEYKLDSATLTDDNKFLVTKSDSSAYGITIKIWDTQNGTCVHTEVMDALHFFFKATIKKKKYLVSYNPQGSLTIRELNSYTTPPFLYSGAQAHLRAISNNNRFFVTAWDNVASIFDSKNKNRYVIRNHTNRIHSLAISTDNIFLITASSDKILISDISGNYISTYNADLPISAACLSQDNRFLVIAQDNEIRLWDIQLNECLYNFNGHISTIKSVDISSDNQFIFAGFKDKTVKVWHISSGNLVSEFKIQDETIRSIRLSADNKFLLITGKNKIEVRNNPLNQDLNELVTITKDKNRCIIS